MHKDTVSSICGNKYKTRLTYPYNSDIKNHYFGTNEVSDFLSFGFSYVEQKDHCVEFIIAHPIIGKRIIKNIGDVVLVGDKDYIGELWTAKIFITEKISQNGIVFANNDKTVILYLDLNKRGAEENNAL